MFTNVGFSDDINTTQNSCSWNPTYCVLADDGIEKVALSYLPPWVSVLGDCENEIKIKNRIEIGLIHFELCLFLFFVKNVNLFWENHKIQKFANFRIKIKLNVDSFSLIWKKTFPPVIFWAKKIGIRFTLFLFINGHICSKIQNFLENADDHNLGTKHATYMKFVSKCIVLDTLVYSTNNSILN